ncbi:MAG: SRPBCC family protein [Saprospiraceae bacterium]|jgi:hypothetical protein|nr:SRPBCC family protein [Saprospiraceae bacterium]
MNTVKKIFVLLLLLVAAYLVAAFLGKSSYRVEREKVVEAPSSLVYNQVSILRNWSNWSPWQEKDPSMQLRFEGQDGQTGATMHWEGDKKLSGKGFITIEKLESPTSVGYVLAFVEPFTSKSSGGFTFQQEAENRTRVKWQDTWDIPFAFRPLMMFMDMDKQVGPDFERGLTRMDSVCRTFYAEGLRATQADTTQQLLQQ